MRIANFTISGRSDVGVERCSCALCLNDDAAIQAALRSAKSRLHSLPSPFNSRSVKQASYGAKLWLLDAAHSLIGVVWA